MKKTDILAVAFVFGMTINCFAAIKCSDPSGNFKILTSKAGLNGLLAVQEDFFDLTCQSEQKGPSTCVQDQLYSGAQKMGYIASFDNTILDYATKATLSYLNETGKIKFLSDLNCSLAE
ncbi:MAG: hypothetical protein ACXWRE_04765 [Pseudobdellovibrionaceae bacterium]